MSTESSLLELCRTEEIYLKFRLSERLRVGDASREWAESSLLELCRAKEIYLKFRLSERLRVGDQRSGMGRGNIFTLPSERNLFKPRAKQNKCKVKAE